MTRKQVAMVIMILKGAYPWCLNNASNEDAINMIEVWSRVLSKYDNDKVLDSVYKIIETTESTFFPSLGTIIKNIEE